MRRKGIRLLSCLGLATSLFWSGCAKTVVTDGGVIKIPKMELPPMEKTFGEIAFSGVGHQLISYRGITILVDPGSRLSHLPEIDYLLLTDVAEHHFGSAARSQLRKDLKTIVPESAKSTLNQEGFRLVKTLSPGNRIMLEKNGAFIFVSAITERNPVSGLDVNSYVLEFDNGKNVFISGENINMDVLRKYLFKIRDEGKEISMAFIYAGQNVNESFVAEVLGLFQPQAGIIVQTDKLEGASFQWDELWVQLNDKFFEGSAYIASPGDKFYF